MPRVYDAPTLMELPLPVDPQLDGPDVWELPQHSQMKFRKLPHIRFSQSQGLEQWATEGAWPQLDFALAETDVSANAEQRMAMRRVLLVLFMVVISE